MMLLSHWIFLEKLVDWWSHSLKKNKPEIEEDKDKKKDKDLLRDRFI